MARFWKFLSALIIVLLALTTLMPVSMSSTASASNTVSSTNQITIYFFYGNGCPHCAIVEPLIDSLAAKYPQVNFIKLETWYNSANKALWLDFNTRYSVKTPVVPEVFIGGQVLIAENAIQTNLEPAIQRLINTNNAVSQLSNSNTEPAGSSALSNPSSSTNPTNNVTGTKPTSEAPIQEMKHNNTTNSPNNEGTPSANSAEGAKHTSKASTVIEVFPPRVKFTTANGTVFNSSQIVISWNYTSGQPNVTAVKVGIDNGTLKSISRDAISYLASGLSDGNHSFALMISDGNSSSEHSLNFTVDLSSHGMDSQKSSTSLFSSPFLIGLAIFIIIVGLLMVFVQRKRRKVN